MTQNRRILAFTAIYAGQFLLFAVAAAAVLHALDIAMCLRAEKRRAM